MDKAKRSARRRLWCLEKQKAQRTAPTAFTERRPSKEQGAGYVDIMWGDKVVKTYQTALWDAL